MTPIDLAPPPAVVRMLPVQGTPAVRAEDAVPPRPGLRLVFSDEFDRRLPDDPGSPWMTTFFWGGRNLPTNKERQLYVDRGFRSASGEPLSARPFEIRDGVLALRAEAVPEERRGDAQGASYTSGLMTTWRSFAFTYGHVEVRARMPEGKGLWPAIWLLRRDQGKNGEIDLVEVLGAKPGMMMATVHWLEDGERRKEKLVRRQGPDLSAAFHVYGLDWTAERITILLDGKEVGTMPTPRAFTEPMYLLINLAVGGWAGPPAPTTRFPAEMLIDYVRIWR